MATVQLLMQLQQTKAYSAMGCKVVSTAAESYLVFLFVIVSNDIGERSRRHLSYHGKFQNAPCDN